MVHEKARAAAAPRKPKKGAVSSPMKVEDMFLGLDLVGGSKEDERVNLGVFPAT